MQWRGQHILRCTGARLPESRRLFLRRYWYGEAVADIAKGGNCRAGKVKSSLFRTRKALRAYLKKEGVML